mgnify:CR=1 FL=1|jgi:hypothetical protein
MKKLIGVYLLVLLGLVFTNGLFNQEVPIAEQASNSI